MHDNIRNLIYIQLIYISLKNIYVYDPLVVFFWDFGAECEEVIITTSDENRPVY
jgi:hypothetical protein